MSTAIINLARTAVWWQKAHEAWDSLVQKWREVLADSTEGK